ATVDSAGVETAGIVSGDEPLALELLEEVALPALAVRGAGLADLPGRGGLVTGRGPLAGRVETGRDDRDLDLVAEPLVEARPEDDVGLGIGCGLDLLGCLGHLPQAQVWRAGDVEEDPLGA